MELEKFGKHGLLKMNLQLFAGEDENTGDDTHEENAEDVEVENEENDGDEDKKEFTQKDLSAVGARENKKGKRAVLRNLGFKSEDEAKSEIEAYRKWKKENMSEDEKAKDKEKKDNAEVTAANKRAEAAEEKLALIEAGVRADLRDDVLAIARTKVDEDNDLSDVLKAMKKEDKYSSFFTVKSGGSTGSSLSHGRKKTGDENIGTRLGKVEASRHTKKSSYFG